jgi:hypothetical protein
MLLIDEDPPTMNPFGMAIGRPINPACGSPFVGLELGLGAARGPHADERHSGRSGRVAPHRISSGDGLGAVGSANESSLVPAGPHFLRKVACSPLQSTSGFASHARGHWFESSSAHHVKPTVITI